MLSANYEEIMKCAYCGTIIKSGKTCFLVEVPGEVIACCRTHAIILETKYKLGHSLG